MCSASAKAVGSYPSRLAHSPRLRGGQPHSGATQGTGQGPARGGFVWLSPAGPSAMLSWARQTWLLRAERRYCCKYTQRRRAVLSGHRSPLSKGLGRLRRQGQPRADPLCLSAWAPGGRMEQVHVVRFGSNLQRALTLLIPGTHSHGPGEEKATGRKRLPPPR